MRLQLSGKPESGSLYTTFIFIPKCKVLDSRLKTAQAVQPPVSGYIPLSLGGDGSSLRRRRDSMNQVWNRPHNEEVAQYNAMAYDSM